MKVSLRGLVCKMIQLSISNKSTSTWDFQIYGQLTMLSYQVQRVNFEYSHFYHQVSRGNISSYCDVYFHE